MSLRAVLVALIALATVSFVVGTAIERNSAGESGHHEGTTPARSEASASSGENHAETGSEPTEAHAKEGAAATEANGESSHAELRPLGIDVEEWPFVALAALGSLALALAAWLRPDAVALLALVGAAMLAFAVLDVREVIHQSDIGKTGLTVLAAFIGVLHAGAAVVAFTMAARARQEPAANGASATYGSYP